MSGRALAAIVVIALAVAAAASLGGGEPPRVAADHTAGADGNAARAPSCYMAPWPGKPDEPGVGPDPAEGNPCVPALARNLIGDVVNGVARPGSAIPVCAGPHHDASTQEAVRLLNAAGFGRALFVWRGALGNCAHELKSGLVSSVLVNDHYYPDPDRADQGPTDGFHRCRDDAADRTAWACAGHYTVRSATQGYVGQAEIRVNPWLDVVTAAPGTTGSCAPAGYAVNANQAVVRLCDEASEGNLQPGRADGTLELTHMLAHELLHVLGLRDYFCGVAPLGTTATLMDSHFKSGCRTERLKNAPNRADASKAFVGSWDLDEYRAHYSPAAVSGLTLTARGSQLVFEWSAADVHAAQGFRLEARPPGGAWQPVDRALVGADKERLAIATPASAREYRVVSITAALGTAAPQEGAISVELSYAPPRYELTATSGPNGRLEGAGSYRAGVTATLTAYPADGYVVAAWSGACAGEPGETCALEMNGPRQAGVTFKLKPRTPTVTQPPKPICDNDPATDIPPCTVEPETETCWDGTTVTLPAKCPPKPSCDNDPGTADIPPCTTDPEPEKPPTPEPTAEPTATPAPTPEPTAEPTATPAPTPTATPAPTPAPSVKCWDGSTAPTRGDCPPEPVDPCAQPGFPGCTPPPPPTVTCWDGSTAPSRGDCPPHPVDPCSHPGFPGCLKPGDPQPPTPPERPEEAALPARPRVLAARGARGATA